MNWDALGAIAETLGAIAVFATLVYLALQVRQTRELLEKQDLVAMSKVYQDRAMYTSDMYRQMAESREIATLVTEYQTADEIGKNRIYNLQMWYMTMMDNEAYQVHLGLLEQPEFSLEKLEEDIKVWKTLGIKPRRHLKAWYDKNKSVGA